MSTNIASARQPTRRGFLKGGAAAALALAAPSVIRAQALGKDGAVPANSRLAIAHIGCGNQGTDDARNLSGVDDVRIVAACDVDRQVREKFQKTFNQVYADKLKQPGYQGIKTYGDFREVLARPDIDAVVISTPDHWHATLAILAAEAGKDIYCQKPLSLTIGEGQKMVAAVRRHGRVLQTGSQQRSHGPFRQGCELVRNGYIGKVSDVYVRVSGPSRECHEPAEPTPEYLDWDFWLGPAPWRPFSKKIHPYNFRNYRDYSGGGMTDWGAHHFDIAQWGLGMDESGPVEIVPPDGKDHPLLTYVYASGVRLYHLPNDKAGQVKWPNGARPQGEDNGITFLGDKGWVEVDRTHIRTFPASLASTTIGANEVRLYRSIGHYRDWVACMRTRQRPICDVAIGASSATVCHLGNIAYWLNRPLKWDPARQQFVGDDEANRWIDRPKRAPWDVV